MNLLFAISDATIDHGIQVVLAVAMAWIAYLRSQDHAIQIQNRDALNGHLAKQEARQQAASLVQSDLSYSQGQAAGPGVSQVGRPRGPLDCRLGPDPMAAPPAAEPPKA